MNGQESIGNLQKTLETWLLIMTADKRETHIRRHSIYDPV